MAIPLRPVEKTEPTSLDVSFFFFPFFLLWDEGWVLGGVVELLGQAGCVLLCFKRPLWLEMLAGLLLCLIALSQ